MPANPAYEFNRAQKGHCVPNKNSTRNSRADRKKFDQKT